MYTEYMYKDSLAHFGIKGQRWGVRRYQNPDGTLTPEGRARDGAKDWDSESTKAKKRDLASNMSDRDFKKKYGHSKAKYMKKLDRSERIMNSISNASIRTSNKIKQQNARNKTKRDLEKEKIHNEKAQKEHEQWVKERDRKDNEINKSAGYSTGFMNYLKKQTGGLSQIDDKDLLDLLEMEYEDMHGSGSARSKRK